MDTLSLLALLVAKTCLLAMPFSVAWLSFRRLSLSTSPNAWLYAVTGLFAAFAAAGVAPWAVALGDLKWPFLVFAVLCPPLWLGVILLCSSGRDHPYSLSEPDVPDGERDVLVLRNPVQKVPSPVFHHAKRRAAANRNASLLSTTSQRILDVAREMRRNPDSTARRAPALLPPPDKMTSMEDLPFLRSGT